MRIPNFHKNRLPAAARIPSSVMVSGMPPKRMPAGQIYLQKVGSPMPTGFTRNMGNRMTKKMRSRYLILRRKRSPGSFFIFWEWNFVQQFLKQSKRVKPAAYKTPEKCAKCHQKADSIERKLSAAAAKYRLQRTNGTGANRPRTGIAVETRHTEQLERAFINLTLGKTAHITVGECCKACLSKKA